MKEPASRYAGTAQPVGLLSDSWSKWGGRAYKKHWRLFLNIPLAKNFSGLA